MSIMLETSLGIYFQGQTQLSIPLLKVLRMIGTQEHILEGYLQHLQCPLVQNIHVLDGVYLKAESTLPA